MCVAIRGWLVSCGLYAVLAASFAVGQDAPDPNPQPEKSDADQPGALREQTIYIPYAKLRDTFEKEGRGVFLPYEKFQELWQAARQPRAVQEADGPPVGALITEIENEASVVADVVEVTARIKIDLLAEGWRRVPLRLSDAAIRVATIDGEPARIVAADSGEYELLIEHEGKEPREIELIRHYAKSYTKSPGQNSVSFQSPLAPVNRWRFRIDEPGVKFNIHPLLAASEAPPDGDDEEAAADDETVVLALLGAAPTVRFDWTPKSEGARGLEALATVRAEQEILVDEGVVHTRARLAYEISRAELTSLSIELPADQKVAGVFDPNVRKWEVGDAEGSKQQINVELFQPARSTQNLTIELEKFHDENAQVEIDAPVIRALGVGRQQGIVVVRLAEGLRGETIERSGLLQMDAGEMPPTLRSHTWDFAYRYASLPFTLKLSVEKVLPRIEVNQLVEAFLEPEQLTVDLAAVYNIERAGVFELKLDVPTGFEVRHVRGHAIAGATPAAVDFHQLSEGDSPQLTVNLSSKAIGHVGLLAEMFRRLDDPNLLAPTGKESQLELALPRDASGNVLRRTTNLIVYAPESLRLTPGELDGLRTISVAEAVEKTPSCRDGRFAALRPVFAFAAGEGDAVLPVSVERRKPYVVARQLLVARIDSGVVKYESTLFYDIAYSGVKSLRVDLPAEIADRIRVATPGIHHQPIDPPPADLAAGQVAWRLRGQTELFGSQQIRLVWEQPIKQLDVGATVDLAVPRIAPVEVDRAWGQIVLVKSETIDVGPKTKPTGLRPIDPQLDLMPGANVADAVRAYEFADDWTLDLAATRYELENVKQTSIERAVIRMVATRSDQLAVQGVYRLRSAKQRLAIQLPQKVGPDGIEFDTQPLRINGRPVTLERGGDDQTFFVPLVGHDADTPLVLDLRYTSPGTPARLELPAFPDDPAVQKVYLCAYLPEERTLLGSRGAWTDEHEWRIAGFFDSRPQTEQSYAKDQKESELLAWVSEDVAVEGAGPATFQTDGTLYVYSTMRPAVGAEGVLRLTTLNETMLSGLVIAGVALFGLLLIRRPASQRLLGLLALLVALVLLGVFLPTLAMQVFDGTLLAAILVVLMVWAGVFLGFELPHRRAALATTSGAAPVTTSPESSPPPNPGQADEEGGRNYV